MILKRLNVEIKKVTKGIRIPTHAYVLVNEEIDDVDLLWDIASEVLEDMIIKILVVC